MIVAIIRVLLAHERLCFIDYIKPYVIVVETRSSSQKKSMYFFSLSIFQFPVLALLFFHFIVLDPCYTIHLILTASIILVIKYTPV